VAAVAANDKADLAVPVEPAAVARHQTAERERQERPIKAAAVVAVQPARLVVQAWFT
jgi:hypothetical protein